MLIVCLSQFVFFLFIYFSIIGAVLIVCGLYVVLWGKSKEMKKKSQLVAAQSPQDESNTVEIVVTSALEDKSNRNKTPENGTKVASDNDDSWENGPEISVHMYTIKETKEEKEENANIFNK